VIRVVLFSFFLTAAANAEQAPPLTAQEIMKRVAANQDRAEEQRRAWIYQQKIHIDTRRTNGKLIRTETAVYEVTPGEKSSEKKLHSLDGRHFFKGAWVDFHGEPAALPDTIDADLIKDFRDDLMNDKSKDGLGSDLFPLTTEEQKKYEFELLGEQDVRGRRAWRIRFRPLDKSDVSWAGEALIDEQEFQPINVFTKLSRRIPFAVRTLLGTDLPGIGFNVNYARFDDGVWFPTTFGTEFRMHIVFVLNRQISVSLENSGFRRASVDSKIDYEEAAVP